MERAEAGRPYLEFLRAGTLSAGLYTLPVGASDEQSPHGEDEVYVVVRGTASFLETGARTPVGPGDVIFVPAGEEHRFVDIADDLELVVVFAPPEGTLSR